MCLNKNSTWEKGLRLQNCATPLHLYVCISTDNNYKNGVFFISPSFQWCRRIHCRNSPIVSLCIYTKSCTLPTFCSSLEGELNRTASCWSAILQWESLQGPCKCKASNICVKSGQKGCFWLWEITLQRQVLAAKLGQYQCEYREVEVYHRTQKNNARINRCAPNKAGTLHRQTNEKHTPGLKWEQGRRQK